MEGQARSQPAISRVPLEERIRTCRPAIVRQPRSEHESAEEKAAGQDGNIIRGED
ncbi:hypothetical protein ACFVVP_12865 [Streptomyces sp. NPDC058128]|uniref:hypothetical protein n=1 Tax=unclassified Streptomyces TaxID=2593676 RepID=UPI000A467072|nr:hypothetical protein [Streptomyces sp. CB02009]